MEMHTHTCDGAGAQQKSVEAANSWSNDNKYRVVSISIELRVIDCGSIDCID
jgi:hypothetical protein